MMLVSSPTPSTTDEVIVLYSSPTNLPTAAMATLSGKFSTTAPVASPPRPMMPLTP